MLFAEFALHNFSHADFFFAYNQFAKFLYKGLLLAVVSRLSHAHTTPPATHATHNLPIVTFARGFR